METGEGCSVLNVYVLLPQCTVESDQIDMLGGATRKQCGGRGELARQFTCPVLGVKLHNHCVDLPLRQEVGQMTTILPGIRCHEGGGHGRVAPPYLVIRKARRDTRKKQQASETEEKSSPVWTTAPTPEIAVT
jgi:hypothetical protein